MDPPFLVPAFTAQSTKVTIIDVIYRINTFEHLQHAHNFF